MSQDHLSKCIQSLFVSFPFYNKTFLRICAVIIIIIIIIIIVIAIVIIIIIIIVVVVIFVNCYLYYSLHWALYRSVIEQRNKATQILMYLYQKATYYIVKIWT